MTSDCIERNTLYSALRQRFAPNLNGLLQRAGQSAVISSVRRYLTFFCIAIFDARVFLERNIVGKRRLSTNLVSRRGLTWMKGGSLIMVFAGHFDPHMTWDRAIAGILLYCLLGTALVLVAHRNGERIHKVIAAEKDEFGHVPLYEIEYDNGRTAFVHR